MGFIKDRIKKWVNSGMTIQTNNNKDSFYNQNVSTWYGLYSGDFVLGKSNNLNLAKAIIDEVVKTTIHEFDFDIKTSNNDLLYLNKYLHDTLGLIATHATIGGAVALKPYISANRVGAIIVPSTNFKAKFDSFGELQEVKFKSVIEEDKSIFTLVETHTYNRQDKQYTITNELFKSSAYGLTSSTSWGSKVPLTACSETENLDDFVTIEDINRHLCVVKTLNNTTYQNVGQSIFAPALDLIQEANDQYDRVMWEYEGGQLAIQANAELFHKSGSSSKKENYKLPDGKERLYVAMYGADNEFNFHVFSPSLRDSNYWTGMNEILRRIEFNCGLSYGVLSNEQEQSKTATEIIASKQRYYSTISNIRRVICECIEEIIESCAVLSGRINNVLQENAFEVVFDIEDSILQTTEEKINSKLFLVDKGVLSLDEFKDWYYRKAN